MVALGLTAAAIAAVVTQQQATVHGSRVTMVLQTSASASDTETLVRTMTALVESEVVGEALRERVGSTRTAEEISDNLTVERPPGSSVLTVSYTDTDQRQSVETARAVIPVFDEQVTELEVNQAGQLAPNYAIQPWGGGAVITTEATPPLFRNALIAGLLGALLAGAGAVIVSQRNPLIHTSREAEEATRLPVVSTPAPLTGGRGAKQWHPADVIDAVLGGLPAALGRDELPRRLLVVGPDNDRQRAVFITHLARALEVEGRRTVVVDADLETGYLSRQLDLGRSPGLADCLRSDTPPADLVVVPEQGPAAGLSVLPAGTKLPMRATSPAVVLASLDENGVGLLVDAPQPSRRQSLGPLLRSVDGVVVLVAAGEASVARTSSLSALVRSLGSVPAAIVLLDDEDERSSAPTYAPLPSVGSRSSGAALTS